MKKLYTIKEYTLSNDPWKRDIPQYLTPWLSEYSKRKSKTVIVSYNHIEIYITRFYYLTTAFQKKRGLIKKTDKSKYTFERGDTYLIPRFRGKLDSNGQKYSKMCMEAAMSTVPNNTIFLWTTEDNQRAIHRNKSLGFTKITDSKTIKPIETKTRKLFTPSQSWIQTKKLVFMNNL